MKQNKKTKEREKLVEMIEGTFLSKQQVHYKSKQRSKSIEE